MIILPAIFHSRAIRDVKKNKPNNAQTSRGGENE